MLVLCQQQLRSNEFWGWEGILETRITKEYCEKLRLAASVIQEIDLADYFFSLLP
jgi:hypothetical protein